MNEQTCDGKDLILERQTIYGLLYVASTSICWNEIGVVYIHLYHSYLSAFFFSAGVPNGEFPEILIAKCRSRFFCTWFFSRAKENYFIKDSCKHWLKCPTCIGFWENKIMNEQTCDGKDLIIERQTIYG
jgi:hypothetical protein